MSFLKHGEKEYMMFEEILEQPAVIEKLSKRFFDENLNIKELDIPVSNFSKIYICASGTSKNAADVAKYLIEKLTGTSTIVEFASEFAHKPVCISKDDLFIAISQSGNTADTFEALKKAKEKGATTFAITNNTESKIHNFADYKVFTDAGKEKSIAATKSFSAQLFVLYVFTIYLAEKLGVKTTHDYKTDLVNLSSKYEFIFNQRAKIKKVAKIFKNVKSLVLIARGINNAVTLEGALKIKETSYIDANGYPSGEFLHGHMAFVDEKIPVISMINKADDSLDGSGTENYDLAISNLKEVKTKRNPILVILKTQNDTNIDAIFKTANFLEIPSVIEEITPFLNTACLQLLSYEIALVLNRNVDEPRSLSKCVDKE